uniref:Uncharacterized protein n=1 Tax=Leersia perrieri TaxID=77586 RepID=A0A0D9WC97_9ORYZ
MASLRRFVNLVEQHNGVYSLRRIDGHALFYPTAAAAVAAAGNQEMALQREEEYDNRRNWRLQFPIQPDEEKKKTGRKKKRHEVETLKRQLPPMAMSMRPNPTDSSSGNGSFDCFRLGESESKIVFTDQDGRAFLYDADERCFIGLPSLHGPEKSSPISISITTQGEEESKLYIMNGYLEPEEKDSSNLSQFEVFDHRKLNTKYWSKSWHCDTLPPPPFVFNSGDRLHRRVIAHAAVGHVIVISVKDLGTFCFDTGSHSWSHAGEWMLPFIGKGEYVDELKLWFGMSAKNGDAPCYADLSPIVRGEPPTPGYIWDDLDMPDEWGTSRMSDLVSLGSGKFCIVRTFQTWLELGHTSEVDEEFPVFTGLEVLPPASASAGGGNGNDSGRLGERKEGLRMIKHKSRRYALLDKNV